MELILLHHSQIESCCRSSLELERMTESERKENTAVIGISWEPKLTTWFPTSSSSSSSSRDRLVVNSNSSHSEEELIDGLYVPPKHDPRKLNKLLRKQLKDTAGKHWYPSSSFLFPSNNIQENYGEYVWTSFQKISNFIPSKCALVK